MRETIPSAFLFAVSSEKHFRNFPFFGLFIAAAMSAATVCRLLAAELQSFRVSKEQNYVTTTLIRKESNNESITMLALCLGLLRLAGVWDSGSALRTWSCSPPELDYN